MEKCKFYREDIVKSPNKEDDYQGTLDKIKPYFVHNEVYCLHESSPKRKDDMGKLECGGDISQCPLKKKGKK